MRKVIVEIADFSFLNKVQIKLQYCRSGYYLRTEHAFEVQEYDFKKGSELTEMLDDIRCYFEDEYLETGTYAEMRKEESHRRLMSIIHTLS